MPTPAELISQGLAKLASANRIDGNKNSYRKDNPNEYTLVMAYLSGGSRPNATSDMGVGLCLIEDGRRALGVVVEPEPEPEPEPGADWFPASWLTGPSSEAFFRQAMPPRKGVLVGIWDSGHAGITRITQREGEVGASSTSAGVRTTGRCRTRTGKSRSSSRAGDFRCVTRVTTASRAWVRS